ncbi:MAG: DegV family protein [Clostridia bacterium]|nr:DegV family protein [Clostridia bacterium]
MRDYVIFVDSACDISCDILNEWGVKYCTLSLAFNDDPNEYQDHDIPAAEFYNKMRNGAQPKTSAANMGKFCDAFESIVKEGYDILYLGFSSGLSATVNFAREAAEEIMSEYEGSKVVVVDSLCASAGYGLLLKLLVDKKNEGASIDEATDYAENTKLNVCHWFTVDDLKYLKAGGRISATTALLGGMLNIKPVMKMDNNGKLISVSKVRGRKAALKAIADLYAETAIDKKDGVVFISHGDCIYDANLLADMIKENSGATVQIITYVGPVIGSHSGPGTLALFFLANER